MTDLTPNDIAALVKLQKIDLETERLKIYLKDVPTLIKNLDHKLEAFTHQVQEDENLVAELNKKYRACESDIQLNIGKIEKSQEKLRSVKTNKEYQSSLKEIDDIKAINSKIEDGMLEYLERIETAEHALVESKRQSTRIVEEINQEKNSYLQTAEQSKKELEALKSERDAAAAALQAELLRVYERQLSKQGDGIAIVEVKKAVCQGCHMNIPPQMYNELQRGTSLKYCPSCERLIYWHDQEERSE